MIYLHICILLSIQLHRVTPKPDDAQKFRRSTVAHRSGPQSILAMAMYALSAVMYAVTYFLFQMVYNVYSFAFASMLIHNVFLLSGCVPPVAQCGTAESV